MRESRGSFNIHSFNIHAVVRLAREKDKEAIKTLITEFFSKDTTDANKIVHMYSLLFLEFFKIRPPELPDEWLSPEELKARPDRSGEPETMPEYMSRNIDIIEHIIALLKQRPVELKDNVLIKSAGISTKNYDIETLLIDNISGPIPIDLQRHTVSSVILNTSYSTEQKIELVAKLLKKGCELNFGIRDGIGWLHTTNTPLFIAVSQNDPKLTRFLVDHGAQTNGAVVNSDDFKSYPSILDYAIQKQSFLCIRPLMFSGIVFGQDQLSALSNTYSHREISDMCAEVKAEADRNMLRNTLLYFAVGLGCDAPILEALHHTTQFTNRAIAEAMDSNIRSCSDNIGRVARAAIHTIEGRKNKGLPDL